MSTTVHTQIVSTTNKRYTFLSRPPPQKKRPTQELPSVPLPPLHQQRQRSNSYTTIISWAIHVQPGSPPPCSPPVHRRHRRGSSRITSPMGSSFLTFIETPSTGSMMSPPVEECVGPNLQSLGYTSAFVHLPRAGAPVSPTVAVSVPKTSAPKPSPLYLPPAEKQTPLRSRTLKRFRSLTNLKSRGSTKSKTTVPAIPSPPLPAPPKKPSSTKGATVTKSASVTKRKKAKYPAPLMNELALAQFADGGSMETNARRHMRAQAVNGRGVGDVYRDGNGGMWMDEDEEWEYAHLLGGDEEIEGEREGWVRFGGLSSADGNAALDLAGGDDKRTSTCSDLDPRRILQVSDEQDDLAAFGSALSPSVLRRPGATLLSRPSRSTKQHLNRSKPEYILDGATFKAPPSISPKSPKFAGQAFVARSGSTRATSRGRSNRRRPTPLNLRPLSPGIKQPTNSPSSGRKDFLESSFNPTPPPRSSSSSTHRTPHIKTRSPISPSSRRLPATAKSIKRIPSRPNVKGLFRAFGANRS